MPSLHYADYLRLKELLSLQETESAKQGRPAHDEVLFIVIHQVYELWFKQILHELESVRTMFSKERVDEKDVGKALARFRRVIEIEKILVDQIRVLETMTPLDFLEFRDLLTPASGFQSAQFRQLEQTLGVNPKQSAQAQSSPYQARAMQEATGTAPEAPSLFDLIERWLERTPFLEFGAFNFWKLYQSAVHDMLSRDEKIIRNNSTLSNQEKERDAAEFGKARTSFEALFNEKEHNRLRGEGIRRLSYRATHAALFINLYRDQPILHLPFSLLTATIDMDELFTTWRYRHTLMVHRMIGMRIGTGGSTGHEYLRSTIDSRRVFTDLANLATFLIPRSALPRLPQEVEKNLGFTYAPA